MSNREPSKGAMRAAAALYSKGAIWDLTTERECMQTVAETIDRETGLPGLIDAASDALYCLEHDAAKGTIAFTAKSLRAAIASTEREARDGSETA